MNNTLEADSIILRYGQRTVLSDIYIKTVTGTITGLVGNNGCGKSSLMKIIFGVLSPESKSIRINGRHVSEPYKKHGMVCYMPQQSCLPHSKSVQSIFNDFKLDFSDFKSLFDVEISLSQKVSELHGSTKRLVEIYVLTKTPAMFTLLDEPFTHLSPLLTEQVMAFLTQEKLQKGIIVTDHNFNYLKSIADDLYLLNNGSAKYIQHPAGKDSYKSLFNLPFE